MPQQLLEVVCTGRGRKELVLDGDCDHFGGGVGPGVSVVRPVLGLVLRVEPGRAGLVVVEEGEGANSWGIWAMVLRTPLRNSLAASSISVPDWMVCGQWEGVKLGLKKTLTALVTFQRHLAPSPN